MALIAAPLMNKRINPYKTPQKRHRSSSECRLEFSNRTLENAQQGSGQKSHNHRSKDRIRTLQHDAETNRLKASRKISVSHPSNLHCLVSSPDSAPTTTHVYKKRRSHPHTATLNPSQGHSHHSKHHQQQMVKNRSHPTLLHSQYKVADSEKDKREIPEQKLSSSSAINIKHSPSPGLEIGQSRGQRNSIQLGLMPEPLAQRKRSRSEYCLPEDAIRELLKDSATTSPSSTAPQSGSRLSRMWKNLRKLKILGSNESPN